MILSIEKIEAKWISEYFQYGICTRIRSDGFTAVQNPQLLCANGLDCLPVGDKNICSCGQDRFLEQNSTGAVTCGKMITYKTNKTYFSYIKSIVLEKILL